MTEPRAIAKNLLRLVILAIVVWGIARAIGNARAEFAEQHLSWSGLRWRWLIVSLIAYGAGLSAMGCFWYAVLHALNQRPSFAETIRAYFVGHLGKYVPGKAMVIVLRTGLIRGVNVDTVIAGVSVFIETLLMMAVGAFLAAVVLSVRYRENIYLMWSSIAMMLVTIVPTLPPVFCTIVRRFRPQFQQRLGEITEGYTFRLFAVGWLTSAIGWFGLTLSFWAALKSLPFADSMGSLSDLFPLLLASVTLAVVLGFVSLIPGGLGVRDWILNELTAPYLGYLAALGGTVVVRLVWLVTEISISIILYVCLPAPEQVHLVADSTMDGFDDAARSPRRTDKQSGR